jgi:hypothetical protein
MVQGMSYVVMLIYYSLREPLDRVQLLSSQSKKRVAVLHSLSSFQFSQIRTSNTDAAPPMTTRLVLEDQTTTRCSMKQNIYARLFLDKSWIKSEAEKLCAQAPADKQGTNAKVIPIQFTNSVKKTAWEKASDDEIKKVNKEAICKQDNRKEKIATQQQMELTPEQKRQ